MAAKERGTLEPTFGSKKSSRARLKRSSITIERPILDERHFEENYQSVERKIKFSIPEPIRSAISPPKNLRELKRFFLLHIPILYWLWTYRKSNIISDVVGGLTIGIMQVSQGLAYSLLAELKPQYGLYTSFIPPLLYAVFGSSRHLSIGTFTLVCLLIGNAINRIVTNDASLTMICSTGDMSNTTAANSETLESTCNEIKLQIAVTIACLSGIIMIVCSLFQLGFVTMFFSDALISGYTTAAGFFALTSQLKYIFDFDAEHVPRESGFFEVPQTWIATGRLIYDHKTNWTSFIVTAVSLLFLILIRIVNKKFLPKWKYFRKFPIPLPGALFLVVIGTGISHAANLETQFNVSVIGAIPTGPPPVSLPAQQYFASVLQDAFIIAMVSFSMNIALAKSFAKKNKYTISPNQEFFACGIVNLIGAFFSCFSSSGSLSRTTVADGIGSKTQVVGLISAILVFLSLIAFGTLLGDLPVAVLAAIVIEALWNLFKQFKDVYKFFKLSKPDTMVWLVTFGATVLLGIDVGLAIGLGFSLFLIVGRIILPPSASLGRAPNTEIFRNRKDFKKVHALPGILIFRFVAPLCYVNGMVFRSRLITAAGIDPAVALTEEVEGCVKAVWKKVKHRAQNVSFDVKRGSSSAIPSEVHMQQSPIQSELSPIPTASSQVNLLPDENTPSSINVVPNTSRRVSFLSDENEPSSRKSSTQSEPLPILKVKTNQELEGSSFEKLGNAVKRKWHRFIGTPTPLGYRRFSDGSQEGYPLEVTAENPSLPENEVRIVVENKDESVDSAITEDEGTKRKSHFLPKRKRNSDSIDSGSLSDTESQPSLLNLTEFDEDGSSQKNERHPKALDPNYKYYNVVSCVADDAELPLQPNLHTIIIDCAPITFIDSSGAEVLEQIIGDYDKIGIQVLLARTGKPNRDMLNRSGFFGRFGKEWLFPSLQDAVNHAECGVRVRRYVHRVNSKIEASHKKEEDETSDMSMEESESFERVRRAWLESVKAGQTNVKFHIGNNSETESLEDLEEENESFLEEEQN